MGLVYRWAAAQAAQKDAGDRVRLAQQWAAAQAAQKKLSSTFRATIKWAAAQAAQKHTGQPPHHHDHVGCRTGSSEMPTTLEIDIDAVGCRTGSSETP